MTNYAYQHIQARSIQLMRENAEDLRARADQLELDAMILEQIGEDVWREGTIIHFAKKFSGSGGTYTYAAIKCGHCWYTTGNTRFKAYSWAELLNFIRRDNVGSMQIWICTEMTPITEAEPS